MSTAHTLLGLALAAGLPVGLSGPPGIGKTAMVRATAASSGWTLRVLELGQCDPTDLGGMPVADQDGTVHRQPLRLFHELNAAPDGAVLLLDDFTAATPAVQAAALRLVLERVAGDLPLADHVRVVLAYNPPDTGGLFALEPTVATRIVHVAVAPDTQRLIAGLLGSWPQAVTADPPEPAAVARWRRDVAAFLHVRPGLVFQANRDGGASPCPRTWELATTLAATAESAARSRADIQACLAACVGAATAAELTSYLDKRDLPDPRVLLDDPDAAPSIADHQRPDRTFAIAGGLVETVAATGDVDHWRAAWQLLAGVVRDGQGDLIVLAARELAALRPAGASMPDHAREVAAILPSHAA